MTGSWLMYKCRLCGDTFPNGHAPDGELALSVAEGLEPWPCAWIGTSPRMTMHHDCKSPIGIGVADLIGATPDE
jgi:hypothetical protein